MFRRIAIISGVLALAVPTIAEAQKMYWVDYGTKKIQRANLDGTNVEDLITTGLEGPTDIAVDTRRGKMYWTDSDAGKIQRASFDGSDVEDLVTDLTQPRGIALDLDAGKIYWTDAGQTSSDGAIHRANLDGAATEALIPEGLNSPWGIALDLENNKMYWADTKGFKIQRANLDGTDVEDLLEGGIFIRVALDVPDGKMYYTATAIDQGAIERANLDGTNSDTLVVMGLFVGGPLGLALDPAAARMFFTGPVQLDFPEGVWLADMDGQLRAKLVSGLENPRGLALALEGPPAIPAVSHIGLGLVAALFLVCGALLVGKRAKDKRGDRQWQAERLRPSVQDALRRYGRRQRHANVLIVIMVFISVSGGRAIAQAPPELFESAGGETSGDPTEDPLILRSRPVIVNFEHLSDVQPGDRRTFNLFDDVTMVGIFEPNETRSPTSYSWAGRIEDYAAGWFVLSVENDVCIANLWLPPDQTFRLRFNADGVHAVQETDLSVLPGCGNVADAPSLSQTTGVVQPACPDCQPEDGSIIDMLIVYTSSARFDMGGEDAIRALIHSAELSTNVAFANSLVQTRVRVLLAALVSYSETGNGRLDIQRLINGTGQLSVVHPLRNAVGADVVSLIVRNAGPAICGIVGFDRPCPEFRFSVHHGEDGSPEGFEHLAFNVVQADCAVDNMAFVHELGHNLGCRHDRDNDSDPGAFDYSHAYIDLSECGRAFQTIVGGDRSIMRVPYFSNPDIDWPGCPIREEGCPPDFLPPQQNSWVQI